MTEIHDLTALALRDRIAAGELTAAAVTAHFLARAAAANPELGAYRYLAPEAAAADAAAADARFAAQPSGLPALHGLPLAIKDLNDVRGLPTSHGTAALPSTVPTADDPLVAVLRAAGAILHGKTQVPEFGLSCHSENTIAPPARNPLDPSRTAGGSSGGSAAAVAAGLLPVAPGSDGGGSVRIPASACGLIGLKPGLGSVPSDVLGGTRDVFGAGRLTVAGPLARTAADAALLYDAMRGDPAERTLAAVLAARPLAGLSIGVSCASPFAPWFPTPLSREAEAALAAGIAALRDRGHAVADAEFTYDPRYPEAFTTIWTAALGLVPLAPGAEARLGTLAAAFRERAMARDPEVNTRAAAALREIAADLERQWGAYDLVLTPAMAHTPPAVGSFLAASADDDYRLQCQYTPFTSMVNVAGLPAITVPTLRTAEGLSMGVQLIGRRGSETLLLRVAEQLSGRGPAA